MKKIEITKAGGALAEYVKRMGKEPVIVTIDGRPVAALLDISNVDWDVAHLTSLPIFATALEILADKLKDNQNLDITESRWLLGVPPYSMSEDERFAPYLVDDDEMVGVIPTSMQDNNEVETPKEEEVANAS